MGLAPKIKPKKFVLKTCSWCGQSFGAEGYSYTRSVFYADGVLPMCNNCIESYLDDNGHSWNAVDKLCQMSDIPFLPSEWEKLQAMNPVGVFSRYSNLFSAGGQYDNVDWSGYYNKYKKLHEEGLLETELPILNEQRLREQRERWGKNYDPEALDYLDHLFNGLMTTQNVNGSLQIDQALKICKMSYEIDRRIASGEDFDKLLASYDKAVKLAEFTPKNVKNLNDFDSTGELFKWLEKKGWRCSFYDKVTRDVVDETIKNIQNFNQRLYTNETGMGDEITRRIEALKSARTLEDNNYYGTDVVADLDKYDNDGYEKLIKDEDFAIDIGDNDV